MDNDPTCLSHGYIRQYGFARRKQQLKNAGTRSLGIVLHPLGQNKCREFTLSCIQWCHPPIVISKPAVHRMINIQDNTCVVNKMQMCIALIKRRAWPKSAMLFVQKYSCRAKYCFGCF